MKKIMTGLTSVLIGLIITAFAYMIRNNASSAAPLNMEEVQKSIAGKILRFHVIANSDSAADQELKLKVKENVIDFLRPYMESSENLYITKELVAKYDDEIMRIARETIDASSNTYNVYSEVTTDYFPLKTYGDIMLPPGEYETYRIVIGDGTGSNWWCMLYPPLCFIDASCGVVPDSSKEQLKDLLSEDEYSVITNSYPKKYKVRFKYLTFLNKLFGL